VIRRSALLILIFALSASMTSAAAADSPGLIRELPVPGAASLDYIAVGDSGVWFDANFANDAGYALGHMDRATGAVSIVPGTEGLGLWPLFIAPDGALWTGSWGTRMARVAPDGTLTFLTTPVKVAGAVLGRDGVITFTGGNPPVVGRMTTTGVLLGDLVHITRGGFPGVVIGYPRLAPDGSIWFPTGPKIVTVTGASVRTITLPATPEGGTPGPSDLQVAEDGTVWFVTGSHLGGVIGGTAGSDWVGHLDPNTGAVTYTELAAFARPSNMVRAADGAMWFTEQGASNIGRIAPDGILTEYPTPTPDAAPFGIAADEEGHVWFTELATPRIGVLDTGVTPPSLPPTIGSARLLEGVPSDPLLTRRLRLELASGSSPADRFEYAWIPPGTTGDAPITPLQTCLVSASGSCRVSYSDTKPGESGWRLSVRAVGQRTSPWLPISFPGGGIATTIPPKPIVIALGDSVTSGHHLDSGDKHVVCDDPNYSYASQVALKLQQDLPNSQWRSAPGPFDGTGWNGYYNYAHSGFSTGKVKGGGINACRASISTPPLSSAKRILMKHRGSWNQVVITAGINDTNWAAKTGPIATIWATRPITSSACETIVKLRWDGYSGSITSKISNNALDIVRGLHSTSRITGGDRAARVNWLGYYNIAGTSSLMPAVCKNAVARAASRLARNIHDGLPASSYIWVSTEKAIQRDGAKLQELFLPKLPWNYWNLGWPHPRDGTGTTAIARVVPNR
jgi:virginiamycin B lyase